MKIDINHNQNHQYLSLFVALVEGYSFGILRRFLASQNESLAIIGIVS